MVREVQPNCSSAARTSGNNGRSAVYNRASVETRPLAVSVDGTTRRCPAHRIVDNLSKKSCGMGHKGIDAH